MEDKWTVDKLDGSNWITWKFQVKHLLLGKGLWKYIEGSATLAEHATEEQRLKFKSESQNQFNFKQEINRPHKGTRDTQNKMM